MFDPDAYALRLLRHDDRTILKEIAQLKKSPPESGEPILNLTLARYENNPFLLYSCLVYANKQGVSVCFSPSPPDDLPADGSGSVSEA